MGVIKGFFNTLMERDVSARDWMKFPETELRKDIIQASLHPIIYFMDKYIQQNCESTIRLSPSVLFELYRAYCKDNSIYVNNNCKGFGIIFKDQIPIDTGIGVSKIKSNGSRIYVIERTTLFNWLQDKEYTNYDKLPMFREVEDDDEI
jgi:hypothetical protein